ncbi:MAG: hypothetical protein U9Q37_05180 [Euryarchaeota archaeon]|nr:hypothetical protein [Euryarchaeota archaeon]
MLLLAGTSAAVMPPVPYFSQCDSRWGSDKPDGDWQAVCDSGCALTSAAMVMAYPADAAITLVIATGSGSAPCDPTTLAAADVNHDGLGHPPRRAHAPARLAG